ncbi:fungal hydrophobin [Flagelloscypha sp. PMI_526]|nr:fungal hydrophobin [Flagelloscypha sp. PMI_526]
MQFKLLSALSLASLAAATALPRRGGGGGEPEPIPASECSSAPVVCCTNGGKASDEAFSPILAALGLNVDLDALVGTGCAALPVVGVGSGAECDSYAYCCEDNSHSLISVNCVPVIVDL